MARTSTVQVERPANGGSSPLQRPQKGEQRLTLLGRKSLEAASHEIGFAAVAANRLLDRRGAAIMKQRAAESQAPESRRANLGGLCCCQPNAVAGTSIVQQQIRKKKVAGFRLNSGLALAC